MGVSNCSYCAIGHGGNQAKICDQRQMDADHVAAWSKGGKTDLAKLRDALPAPQPGQGQPVIATLRGFLLYLGHLATVSQ